MTTKRTRASGSGAGRIYVMHVPRSSDETLLRALRLRCSGLSEGKVAKVLGMPRSMLATYTTQVREADIRFSVPMEDQASVEAAYP